MKNATRKKKKLTSKRYHHGNLRDALIKAAAQLIEDNGSEEFTMLEAAELAGVSNAAPYRHFQDKEALLGAVCELGFLALDEQMREIAAQYEYGSQACIVELGKGYIRFVTSRPAFFNLMWGEAGYSRVHEAATEQSELRVSGLWLLVNQIDAWCERYKMQGVEPVDLALKLWAMAIGISHLVINNHLERFVEDVDPYELLSTSANALLRGLQSD